MLTVDAIWRSILKEHHRRASDMARIDCDTQPLPVELLPVLRTVYALASERRALELSDYRPFWKNAADDQLVSLNIIHIALDDFSRRRLQIDSRAFLDHMRHCAHYLAEQGYQGLADDRNHWNEVVTGNWTDPEPR
jgi:hypothetical protein